MNILLQQYKRFGKDKYIVSYFESIDRELTNYWSEVK